MKVLVAASLVFFTMLIASCSNDTGSQGTGTTRKSDGFKEGTLVSSSRGAKKTAQAPRPEATLGPEANSPAVLLRLEGDPGTTFSGTCVVGSNQSVLSGRIPKSYAFDPRGRKFSCRLEKRDPGRGDLKVILVVGNTTRSVQQTDARGNALKVSYPGD